jgi:hypothetical protein
MFRERASFDWLGLALLFGITVALSPARPQPRAITEPEYRCREAVAPPRPEARASELDEQLAAARAIAFDFTAPPIDGFEALRRARTLDIALGGNFSVQLTERMRDVAPAAARAYRAAGDKEGAQLAEHTAAIVGAPR